MRFTRFLLGKYLFPRGGNLLSLALWISVTGVALGVAQLLLVLAVMSGFLELFEAKYTQITSQLVVLPRGEQEERPEFRQTMEKVPGVTASTPFFLSQGMIIGKGVAGVTLEGISLVESSKVTNWEKILSRESEGALKATEPNWIWLGQGLANKLSVKLGDTVQLLFASKSSETMPFVVRGITKFGIYDHDLRYAYLSLPRLLEITQRDGSEPFYKLKLRDGSDLSTVSQGMQAAVGDTAEVKRWSDINKNIFLAVRHQKQMLFFVLEIVVALAAINVINLLMMSTHQRKRDLAILRAMGMRLREIVAFFVLQGAAVGAAGVAFGIGLGFVICALAERYQPEILSEAIYNVTRLPFKIEWPDVGLIAVVALVVCVLFSLIPAWRAAKLSPVQSLRWE